MSDKLYIGVDIAKEGFVAAVWRAEQGVLLGQFANNQAGYAELAAKLTPYATAAQEPHVVAEPTGGYEMGLIAYAYEQGWQVCLPNPKKVRDWAKGSGRRAKTDNQDALLLAEYGAKQQPQPQEALPPAIQELAELLERRHDLTQLQRSESNRLAQYQARPRVTQSVVQSIQRTLETLHQELAAIEQAIQDLLNQHPDLKDEVKCLRTVPGVGAKNVLPILVILYRWQARTQHRGSPKGLVAFLGLDPQPYDSGRTVHKRATISKMGDGTMRQLLYMGALGGIRGDNPLRQFYRRLVDRGKAKRLALVAAARKILIWAWHVFSQRRPFDLSRFPQAASAV